MSGGYLCTLLLLPLVVHSAVLRGSLDKDCTTHLYQSPTCYNPAATKLKTDCGNITQERRRGVKGTLFFQIGDFGLDGECEAQVAALVKTFESHFGEADFLMSVGDNNYWEGECHSIHKNIGAYYSRYIPKPGGCIDDFDRDMSNWHNATETAFTRFWPVLGNHDWNPVSEGKINNPDDLAYFKYFDFLETKVEDSHHKGAYYKFSYPHMDLYALNTNLVDEDQQQEMLDWLKSNLANGTAPFQVIFGHHPSHTTAKADPSLPWLRLPFHEWSRDKTTMYFCGHEHVYERFDFGENRTTHVINGLGGHTWRYHINDCAPEKGSRIRYNEMHGAMVGWATEEKLEWCFYNAQGEIVDHHAVPTRGRK